MRIHICGVRGSIPVSGAAFLRYGGHTPCVAVTRDGDSQPTLVLDAGSGITQLPALLSENAFAGSLLLTHLHWDHVQGLPFCHSADNPKARVRLLIPAQEDGTDAVTILSRSMSPPHFPIGPEGLRGDWEFASLEPGAYELEGFAVLALEVPHKGGRTYGYRISDEHASFTYISDHCPTLLGSGPDGFGAHHPAAVELCQDADLLVHDAQLLPVEAAEAGFGHAVADYAVGLAQATGVRSVQLFHHKPERTDDELDELAARFAGDPRVGVAAEGMVFDL